MQKNKPNSQTENTRIFFNSLASDWSQRYKKDPEMANRVQKFYNKLTHHLQMNSPSILDFGCGSGDIIHSLKGYGFTLFATDVSEEMLHFAESKDTEKKIRWCQYSGTGPLPFSNQQFHAVISSSVFEYLDAPFETLIQIHNSLHKDGLFIFSVPNLKDSHRKKEDILRKLSRLTFLKNILLRSRWAEGVRYLSLSKNRYSLSKWQDLCKKANLKLGWLLCCH